MQQLRISMVSCMKTSRIPEMEVSTVGVLFAHRQLTASCYSGIYAELLANRAFQGSNYNATVIPGFNGSLLGISENPVEATAPVLTAWAPIGDDVRMTLDRLHPVSKALPTAMEVDFPLYASGEVGFQNFGKYTQPLLVKQNDRSTNRLTCCRLVGYGCLASRISSLLLRSGKLSTQSGQPDHIPRISPEQPDW